MSGRLFSENALSLYANTTFPMDTITSRAAQLRQIPSEELEQMLQLLLQDENFINLYNRFLQGNQPSQNRMSFTTGFCINTTTATRNEAERVFREILTKIKAGDSSFDWVPYMEEELTVIGKGLVMNYMLKYRDENADAIAKRIVGLYEDDQMGQLLANHEPLFRIEVREVAGKALDETGRPYDGSSRYAIYLCSNNGHEKQILQRPKNGDDLTIYLWFLLFPKEDWKLQRIWRNYDNLEKLCRHCFYSREFTLGRDRDRFPTDFKAYKSRIKTSISHAVKRLDTPDWYILDRDQNNIALPEELIFLPDSLQEFHDNIALL